MKQNKKELIISLIKDNLKNTRLVVGLDKLGLDSGKYHLQLSDTVFKLIGFKSDEHEERVFEEYVNTSMKVSSIDIFMHPEKLEAIATKIYETLMQEQKLQIKMKKKIN
ncbi:MAG: hypothetical protein ACT4ON_01010 [Bacteroidota bacterium]